MKALHGRSPRPPSCSKSPPYPLAACIDRITGTNGGGQPRNNIQPSLGPSHQIVLAGFFPQQGGPTVFELFLGQVFIYINSQRRVDHATPANGQTLSVTQNSARFRIAYGTGLTAATAPRRLYCPDLQSRATSASASAGPGHRMDSRTKKPEVKLLRWAWRTCPPTGTPFPHLASSPG